MWQSEGDHTAGSAGLSSASAAGQSAPRAVPVQGGEEQLIFYPNNAPVAQPAAPAAAPGAHMLDNTASAANSSALFGLSATAPPSFGQAPNVLFPYVPDATPVPPLRSTSGSLRQTSSRGNAHARALPFYSRATSAASAISARSAATELWFPPRSRGGSLSGSAAPRMPPQLSYYHEYDRTAPLDAVLLPAAAAAAAASTMDEGAMQSDSHRSRLDCTTTSRRQVPPAPDRSSLDWLDLDDHKNSASAHRQRPAPIATGIVAIRRQLQNLQHQHQHQHQYALQQQEQQQQQHHLLSNRLLNRRLSSAGRSDSTASTSSMRSSSVISTESFASMRNHSHRQRSSRSFRRTEARSSSRAARSALFDRNRRHFMTRRSYSTTDTSTMAAAMHDDMHMGSYSAEIPAHGPNGARAPSTATSLTSLRFPATGFSDDEDDELAAFSYNIATPQRARQGCINHPLPDSQLSRRTSSCPPLLNNSDDLPVNVEMGGSAQSGATAATTANTTTPLASASFLPPPSAAIPVPVVGDAHRYDTPRNSTPHNSTPHNNSIQQPALFSPIGRGMCLADVAAAVAMDSETPMPPRWN